MTIVQNPVYRSGLLTRDDKFATPIDGIQGPLRQLGCSRASPIRLLIAECHCVIQEGLSMILASQPDMAVIAKATTSAEAVLEFRRHKPDITLMNQDVRGTDGIGLDALVSIRTEFPSARVIMLTNVDAYSEIKRALRAGADSYVLLSASKNELLEIIRSVHRGRKRIPPDVAARLAEHLRREDLTARETEVLTHIRDGHSNKQIADRLSIAEATVNFHIKNLVGKLQATGRTHAVIVAIRRGLLWV